MEDRGSYVHGAKILSLGCSVGDEILSAKTVFPMSPIYATDVSYEALSVASDYASDFSKVFPFSMKNVKENGPYDIIIASAVLCTFVNNGTKNPTVPDYEKFTQLLTMIYDNLSVGGILIAPNSSFRFPLYGSTGYWSKLRSDLVWRNGHVAVFTPEGHPYLEPVPNFLLDDWGLYAPGQYFAPVDDEDLADCMLEKRLMHHPEEIHWVYVSPIPDEIEYTVTATRMSTDYSKTQPAPNKAIQVRFSQTLARNLETGQRGYINVASHKTLMNDSGRLYVRPQFWEPIND